MKYEELIETLTEIVNNDTIYKKGLTLTYTLDAISHRKLDEHVFFTRNPEGNYTQGDVIELESDGVLIKILKEA